MPEKPEKPFDDIPTINASRFFILGLPENEHYRELRLALSLVSDLYFLLEGILKQGELMEIEEKIKKLDEEARKFEDIRNFFTHLDSRIYDLEHHGVDGERSLSCGIKYGSDAKNCFHLVIGEGEIHFSDHKEPKEVDVSKTAFDPIFEEAKNLYRELTNNKLPNGRKTFPSPESFYSV